MVHCYVAGIREFVRWMTTMNYRFSIIIIMIPILLVISMSQSYAQSMCDEITIDMPHGWWRIVVNPDGSGTLAFGALPNHGKFPPGTMDHRYICLTLRKIALKDKETLSGPIGTVEFQRDDDSEQLAYFNDWRMASDLFDLAWRRKEEPKNNIEKIDLETLAKFWEKRELPKK
jgi:hypothetical protein